MKVQLKFRFGLLLHFQVCLFALRAVIDVLLD
uniref:Uncharacterized protein n=1 Tax=Anguilla anguilla TaxID=7936 RepID=A0A0E9PHP0_ANGAN